MDQKGIKFSWNDIVRGMKQKDNGAFEAFYDLTYSKLKKRMLVKTGFNEQDTEDLLQEVYIRVFSKIGDLKDPEAVIGWANSICDSIFLDHVKKETRRAGIANVVSESALQNPDDETDDFSLDMIADPDSDIEALIEQQEVQSILKEIISALPDMSRNCIELQMSDKSVREISEELQLNENTVKTLIRRAKLQIKDKVLDLEKKGTKLYGFAPLVFFVYIYRIWSRKSEYIPAGSVKAIAEIASIQHVSESGSAPDNIQNVAKGRQDLPDSSGMHPGNTPGQKISSQYRPDSFGITEELKGQKWQNSATTELKGGEKAADYLRSSGVAKGIGNPAPAVSAGTASVAGTAGLGIGKIIAIVAAGVLTTAAVAIGARVAINSLMPPADNLISADSGLNQTADALVIDENDEQSLSTEKEENNTSETEAVIYEVSEDFLGKWGSCDKLGVNPQPDIVSITDVSDGRIIFSSIINSSIMQINETAVMHEDGRAYFTDDNGKQGNLTLNNSGQLILYIDEDNIGEIVFTLRDKFNHTPFVDNASALDILKSLYETLYRYNQVASSDIEHNYSINENGCVITDQYYSFSYDEDGRILDGNFDEYEYDSQGNLLAKYSCISYRGDSVDNKPIGYKLVDGNMEYIYDLSDYDPATLGAGLTFYCLIYYEYDNEGKLLSRFRQGISDSIYSSTYTLYEYDDKGRIIQITEHSIHYIDRSLGKPLVIRDYSWDEDGSCLITEDRTIEGGPESTMHYELSTQHSEVQLSSNEYILEFGVPVSPKYNLALDNFFN